MSFVSVGSNFDYSLTPSKDCCDMIYSVVIKRAFTRFVVEVELFFSFGKPRKSRKQSLRNIRTNTLGVTMVPYKCLVATYSFDGKSLTLNAPYHYKNKKMVMKSVPSGFKFNGSSIPRLAWTLLGESPMQGAHVHASVVHDYAYQNEEVDVTRKESDSLYLQMCVQHGMKKSKALIMWAFIRVFGYFAYKERKWNT